MPTIETKSVRTITFKRLSTWCKARECVPVFLECRPRLSRLHACHLRTPEPYIPCGRQPHTFSKPGPCRWECYRQTIPGYARRWRRECRRRSARIGRSEEHTSELQSLRHLVCRL